MTTSYTELCAVALEQYVSFTKTQLFKLLFILCELMLNRLKHNGLYVLSCVFRENILCCTTEDKATRSDKMWNKIYYCQINSVLWSVDVLPPAGHQHYWSTAPVNRVLRGKDEGSPWFSNHLYVFQKNILIVTTWVPDQYLWTLLTKKPETLQWLISAGHTASGRLYWP